MPHTCRVDPRLTLLLSLGSPFSSPSAHPSPLLRLTLLLSLGSPFSSPSAHPSPLPRLIISPLPTPTTPHPLQFLLNGCAVLTFLESDRSRKCSFEQALAVGVVSAVGSSLCTMLCRRARNYPASNPRLAHAQPSPCACPTLALRMPNPRLAHAPACSSPHPLLHPTPVCTPRSSGCTHPARRAAALGPSCGCSEAGLLQTHSPRRAPGAANCTSRRPTWAHHSANADARVTSDRAAATRRPNGVEGVALLATSLATAVLAAALATQHGAVWSVGALDLNVNLFRCVHSSRCTARPCETPLDLDPGTSQKSICVLPLRCVRATAHSAAPRLSSGWRACHCLGRRTQIAMLAAGVLVPARRQPRAFR